MGRSANCERPLLLVTPDARLRENDVHISGERARARAREHSLVGQKREL